MTDLVTEVFGFRIPMTPAVILPTLVFATIWPPTWSISW